MKWFMMIMMANGIRGRWGLRFPDICLTFEEKLRKKPQPEKLAWPEIDSGPDWWEATMLSLDHSGGQLVWKLLGVAQNFTRKHKHRGPFYVFWSVNFFRHTMQSKSSVVNLAERHETLLVNKWVVICNSQLLLIFKKLCPFIF